MATTRKPTIKEIAEQIVAELGSLVFIELRVDPRRLIIQGINDKMLDVHSSPLRISLIQSYLRKIRRNGNNSHA